MTKQNYNIKPSDAINYNNTSDKAAFVIPYGGTPEDPEYLYPEELQASSIKAFKNDEDYNRYIGNQAGKQVSAGISKFGHQFMPVLAGTAVAPWLISGGIAAYSNPFIRTGLDVIGSVDGVRNFFSGNGVQKTIRLAKEGDTWGAVKSGAGDVFDILGTTDLIRIGSKFNRANRALHALDVIEPTDYRHPWKRGLQWAEDIITDKPVDINNLQWRRNPQYGIDKLGETYLLRGDHANAARLDATAAEKAAANEIALNAREDALRMYLGFPQKYDTYVPNGDGTFSYNIEKLKGTGFNFEGFGSNYDYLTSNGGNWTSKGVRDIETDGFTTKSMHSVEDVWDLNPFRNSRTPLLKHLEAGKIIGGKPFTLKMDIPLTTTPYGPVLGHKTDVLGDMRKAIQTHPAQLKFVDDVTKGARVARTTSEKPIGELIDYTNDMIDAHVRNFMYGKDGVIRAIDIHNKGGKLK